MKRGPKPQPDSLKLLKGSRRSRVRAPRPAAPLGRPVCPDRFGDPARAEWGRLCDELEKAGVLSGGHGFALAIYCGAYERLLTAEAALHERGVLLVREIPGEPPVIKVNPAAGIAARCESQMGRVLDGFGLTPQSHASARGPEAGPDRFTDFLAKKPKPKR